jgi:antirestriction protein ArdC
MDPVDDVVLDIFADRLLVVGIQAVFDGPHFGVNLDGHVDAHLHACSSMVFEGCDGGAFVVAHIHEFTGSDRRYQGQNISLNPLTGPHHSCIFRDMSKTKKDFDLYQIISDKICAELEEGRAPWQQPWRSGAHGAPVNFVSKKAYRGINVMLLGMSGFSSPYWMTYKQAQAKGGHVRPGEKTTMVVFFKMLPINAREEKGGVTTDVRKSIPLLRYYNVFNAEQIDGIEFPSVEEPVEFNPIEEADAILDHFAEEVPISYGGDRAFYQPAQDRIQLPLRESFDTPESFYSTAFHEAGHATGHESRLAREGVVKVDRFGSEKYGKEELIAEMTAAFVSAEVGIERIAPNAAYLRNWLEAIKGDKKLVVQASFKAAKAADYVLGRIEEPVAVDEPLAVAA